MGKWFKRTGKRDEIFLATKYGYKGNPFDHVIDSSAKYTKESCEKALKTLGVDCIDLCKFIFSFAGISLFLVFGSLLLKSGSWSDTELMLKELTNHRP